MNLQSRHVAAKRPTARRRGKDQKSWAVKLYVMVYLLVVISIFFGVANYRIDLNRKISNLQRSTNLAKQEIYELEREIQALKIDYQRFSSLEHVNKCIARYNLPFRASDPRQVRYFAVKPGIKSRAAAGKSVSLSYLQR